MSETTQRQTVNNDQTAELAERRDIGLNQLVQMAHANSRSHGWYDGGERNIPEMLALIHSEVSEALEDYRRDNSPDGLLRLTRDKNGKPVGFASEIADIVIRVADLCGYLGIDLASAVRVKHKYNVTRPYRHGGKAA
jgi:NTP pyrophosphatase (non-canonical NTP hydrolase)